MKKGTSALVTGGTGFIGGEIVKELQKNDFEVCTVTRGKRKAGQLEIDLTTKFILNRKYDLVVHCAGLAHVLTKNQDLSESMKRVNIAGTSNLLDGIVELPETFIYISSCSVYGCEEGVGISESHPLNGTTAYARSKIRAEQLVSEWCGKNEVHCVILRLPLVVGNQAPGNLRSIVSAIRGGWYYSIRGNDARRSMVLVQDIAELVPRLVGRNGIYNLTDSHHPAIVEFADAICKRYDRPHRSLPSVFFTLMAKCGDFLSKFHLYFPLTSSKLLQLTKTLTFDDSRACHDLCWNPKPVLPYIKSDLDSKV